MLDATSSDDGAKRERQQSTPVDLTPQSFASEMPTIAPETVFKFLADCHRRTLLSYLENASNGTTTVSELAAYVSQHACAEDTPSQVAIQLHHAALPKLADTGLLDYDAAEQTVEYIGHPLVEECLDLVDE